MENFIVSARKYRPATFESVVGQEHITSTLRNAISRGQLAHAYLFCGPRGVGKTTCARIFAKAINCLNPGQEGVCGQCESCRSFNEGRSFNIHELDAASNNSVDDIRSLTEQVRIPPQIGRYSVYIIDEVHMLSAAAFNAFLKTLEEPPAHAVFILATTEKHKIIPTILSRCQIYDFNRIRVEDGVKYLRYIAGQEGVTCDDESLNLIAQKADGGMRDALSMFDKAVSFCGSQLDFRQVAATLNVLDYDTYFNITDSILAGDYPTALTAFDEVLRKGFSPQTFAAGLNAHFRDLLMCRDAQTAGLLEVTGSLLERYKAQAARCDTGFLFEALSLVTSIDNGLRNATNQRLNVELGLMKLCGPGQKKNSGSERPVAGEPRLASVQPVRQGETAAPGGPGSAPGVPSPEGTPQGPAGPTGGAIPAGHSDSRQGGQTAITDKPVAADEAGSAEAHPPGTIPAGDGTGIPTGVPESGHPQVGNTVRPDAGRSGSEEPDIPVSALQSEAAQPEHVPPAQDKSDDGTQSAPAAAQDSGGNSAAAGQASVSATPPVSPVAAGQVSVSATPVAPVSPPAPPAAGQATAPTADATPALPADTTPVTPAIDAPSTAAGRQPAARRGARPTLSGPAIGDLLGKPVGLYETADDAQEETALPAANPGSAAKIEASREKFIKRLNATRPRLAMAFHAMKVDGNRIKVAVPTPDLRDEILRNRTEILTLLSETARIDGYMQLEVVVREDSGPKKPVRVEDKLRYLTEKNPALTLLRQKLDMDIE